MKKVIKKETSTYSKLLTISLLAGAILFFNVIPAAAQTRIVVLPFYVEEGRDVKEGGSSTAPYRRMMRFINNQLTRHNFEVINPFATEAKEKEYNRLMERSREDSVLACMEVCKKYSVDVAYIVWLKIKIKTTSDGYCKTSARLDGEGYDSGGRDLGIGVSKTFKITKRDCDDAIAEVEKEIGDLVGRKLTGWSGNRSATTTAPRPVAVAPVAPATTNVGIGGVLQRRSDELASLINIKLDGATEYELTEVFGKVINTARGVVEAKRFGSRIVPDNPQASYVTWRVRIQNSDPFRLQANVMKMINDILDSGGEIRINGVPYRYSAAEVDLLKGIRTGDTTSREIQFVIDRERARDREFQGRHDPYNAPKNRVVAPGFE